MQTFRQFRRPAATSITDGVKISGLPAATAANPSDQIEVNQDGTSRRLTLAQIVAGKPLDVRDFGATVDGSSDDTAAVTAAVAAAAASGQTLYWPPGTVSTTASIPLLHTVRHAGPGIIKRGASLFAVEPRSADTNHLYVAPAGVTANDGLSAAQPTTPQAAADALVNYGPVLVGTWQIDFAAGSQSSIALADELTGNMRLIGVPTGDFRSAPTSIIDKALSGTATSGVYYAGPGKRLLVKDLKVINFSTLGQTGFRATQKTISYYENCHSYNCSIGVYQLDHAEHYHSGGIHDGAGTGLYGIDELFGVVRSFRIAGSKANRTTVKNFQFGVHSKELCTGHFDFLQIMDCDYGIEFTRFCTANLADMDFRRNGVGVAAVRAAIISNADITWHGHRITAASWAAGVATFTFALDSYSRGVDVAVGERFDITNATPSGYNGSFVALSATDTVVTAAMAANPGAWASGGRIDANIIQVLPIDQTVLDNIGTGGNIEAEILPPYLGQTSRLRSTFTVPFTLEGTTGTTTAIFYPMTGFLPGQFQAAGYEISLYAAGTYDITGASSTLHFRAGASNIHYYVLPPGAKSWVMEARFVITATGDFQHHSGTLSVDGEPVQVKRGTSTYALSTLEYNYGVWGTLTDAADWITGEVGRLYTTNM